MSLIKADSRWHLLSVPLACSPLVLLALYPSVGEWTVFFGRFHPVFLHLPIGILLLTALLECMQIVSFGHLKFSTRTPLFFGTIGAVVAMALGVLLMSGEAMEGALVESHLIWGIATAVAAVLALLIRSLPAFSHKKALPWLYRGVLAITCSIMGWASHQGASITHGETYLTAHIPWLEDAGLSDAEQELAEGIRSPLEERDVYQHLIAPIFDGKCYECHQTRSFKGKLVMDTTQGLLAGGETGPAIVPGSIEDSLALARVYLPLVHEDRMPPANEPQLTEQELQLIEWWVESGAPFAGAIANQALNEDLEEAIAVVSEDLLEQLNAPEAEATHALSYEAVATLREPLQAEVSTLLEQYPGVVRYLSNQGAELSVSCFHDAWNDADVMALTPVVTQVQELTLPSSQLSVKSAEVMNQMEALSVLDLRGAKIDDSFVNALTLANLTRLNLFQTQITDLSLETLAELKSLKALYLGSTDTSAAAVAELRSQLPNCKILHDSMQ